MSLYAALQVAVGGLSAQSSSIGNISDNLANSQTTGYKAIDTRFESLVTQSSSTVNDPGGVRATPLYTNSKQGTIIEDSNATSLAISGSGYFPVREAVVGADGLATFGGTTFFTRAGDFSLNKSGYLVNSGNYYLTGYNVDSSGVVDTSTVEPIQISDLLDNPVGTSTVTYAANLPSSAETNFASSPSTIQVYDSLGGAHDMTYTWTKTGTSEWSLQVTVPEAISDGGTPPTYTDYDVSLPFIFNETTNAGTIASIGAATAIQTATLSLTGAIDVTAATAGAAGNNIDVSITDVGSGDYDIVVTDGTTTETYSGITIGTGPYDWTAVNAAINSGALATSALNGGGTADPATLGTLPLSLDLAGGAEAEAYTVVDNSAEPVNTAEITLDLDFAGSGTQSFSIDFGTYDVSSGVTQFADTNVSVTTLEQNGIPRGSFQALAIDENGFVTLNYDNGRSRTIAQIPVVQFFAEGDLQRMTGGAFAQTLASGSARYSASGSNGAGTVSANALEGSNVDIAQEFTKLIQAQQVYSANAKTITTTNNMMQEAINIIR